MNVHLLRLPSTEEHTLGALVVGGTVRAFTVEDKGRAVKVPGVTRIPAGTYRLKVRTFGGFHQRYALKFGAFHRGMIEIADVPGFSDVLIHIGNTAQDTRGCVLVGQGAEVTGTLANSTLAYQELYSYLFPRVERGEATLTIHDPAQCPQ